MVSKKSAIIFLGSYSGAGFFGCGMDCSLFIGVEAAGDPKAENALFIIAYIAIEIPGAGDVVSGAGLEEWGNAMFGFYCEAIAGGVGIVADIV